jgi:hypothetical protein
MGGNNGHQKKINSETKTFWDSTKDARVKVEQWPSWKLNLNPSSCSDRPKGGKIAYF